MRTARSNSGLNSGSKRPSSAMRFSAIALAVAGVAMVSPGAQAAALYWDLNGATANSGSSATGAWNGSNIFWNTESTGTGGTPQADTTSSDDLTFSSGSGLTSGTITLSAGRVASSLTFEESGVYTLTGGDITLSGANAINFNNGTGANVINSAIILGASTTFNHADNSLQTFGGGVTGAFNLVLNAGSTGAFTFQTGSLNNAGSITNSGAGANTTTISSVIGANVTGVVQNSATSTLALTGANTAYAGTTTLTAGTLRGQNSANTNVLNAFGTGAINLDGGTLQLRANGSANSQTIATNNDVVVGSSAATIDVNRVSSNSGGVFALDTLTLGAGQLTVSGGNSFALRFTGSTTLTADATINTSTANLALNGVTDDSGNGYGITKMGAGSLTLGGANTYSGPTAILEGTLSLGTASSLGNATSAVLLGNTTGSANATLADAGTGNLTIARNIIVQGGNTGVATINSPVQSNTNSAYSGTITLGSATLGHGLTLSATSFHNTSFTGVIQDPAGLSTAPGDLTLSSSGAVKLLAANTYTGDTILTSGTLQIGNAQALGLGGVLKINGGAISHTGGTVLTGISGIEINNNFNFSATAGAVNLGVAPVALSGSRRIVIDNGGVTIGGAISGAGGAITYSGTQYSSSLSLNGANTFDGGVLILATSSNATLNAGNSSAVGSGQVRLSSSGLSRLNVATANLIVDSLSSAITTPSFVGGTGSTNGTNIPLVFTGGGGTGAAGTVTVAGGAITGIAITDYGSDYTSAPAISFAGQGTGTVTAGFAASSVILGANTLTIAGTNASPAVYSGVLSGTNGKLTKQGAGSQTLTGVSTYTGATTVTDGLLGVAEAGSINGTSGISVNGANAVFHYDSSVALTKPVTFGASGGTFVYNENSSGYGGGDLVVGANATLAGAGKINGSVDADGGTISPGNSPGVLSVGGDVTLGTGTLDIELSKSGAVPVAGLDYDQLSATGASSTVDLDGGNLALAVGSGIEVNDLFFIVSNANASGGTTGLFATLNGVANAALSGVGTFTVGGTQFAISYTADVAGGTFTGGNDVALQAVVPEPASLALLGLGAMGLLGRRRGRH